MSRYSKKLHGTDKPFGQKDIIISWGFDHVLGYWYDIQEWNTIEAEYDVIEEWNSGMGGSRSKMLEFLIKYNCPEEHRSMVGLDMVF
jgi:hypothetical protein